MTDYLDIPTRYADAVLAVYGTGLIQGDQNGSFNGQNSMTRQEVATVMDRLTTLQKKTSEGGTTGETLDVGYHLELTGDVAKEGTVVLGERIWAACYAARNEGGDYPSYGQDRSGFTHTSSNPSVVQVEHDPESWNWYLTALSLGSSTFTITDPNGVSLSFDITVVSQRENVAMKTYQVHVNLRNEKHTIRGNAYKETTYLYDTPFKLYYTRDGETFQLVTEGRTPVYDPKTQFKTAKLEVELPEDSFYSEDAGFYVSAEAELDGQRIVTSDLRTDGRDFIKLTQNIDPDDPYEAFVTLAPPEGEKSHFPFKGKVIGGSGSVANATVQLYLENGMLVGETTANTDGTFEMECVVDEIDGGFDKNAKIYRLVFSRPADSKRYSTVGLSLVKLKVAPILNEEGWGPMNFEMTIFW